MIFIEILNILCIFILHFVSELENELPNGGRVLFGNGFFIAFMVEEQHVSLRIISVVAILPIDMILKVGSQLLLALSIELRLSFLLFSFFLILNKLTIF
jgi:hypothetical protein